MLEEESSQPFDFWVVWGKRGRVIFVGSITKYFPFFRYFEVNKHTIISLECHFTTF